MALFGKRKIDDSQTDPYYNQPPFNPQQGFGQQPQQDLPQEQPAPDYGAYPNYPEPAPESFAPPQDDIKERVEEIAEAIIDEKWNELIKDINKVIEWKERTDMELTRIQQDIANLKERFEALHKGILGKITEYDQNLTNVGTDIKAMEMTFQKILPTFTENVNKLDRLVKGKIK